MRLDALRSSPMQVVLQEKTADQPNAQEKIAWIAAMVAKQGKDPGPIVKALRSELDPAYQARQTGRTKFGDWIKSAKQGDTVTGKAFDRKLRVTALDEPKMPEEPIGSEPPGHVVGQAFTDSIGRDRVITIAESKLRKVVFEDFFGVGNLILGKLRKLIGDYDPESPKTKAAIDEFPALSALLRHARKAQTDISEDPTFWDLVDKVTGGKSKEVKKAVEAVYEIQESDEQEKTIIQEAKLSEVMTSIGIKPEKVQELIKSHGLNDMDYDLGQIRSSMTPEAGLEKPKPEIAKTPGDPHKISMSNQEYAAMAIKAAAAILRAEAEAGQQANTPEEKQAVSAQVSKEVDSATEQLKDPSVVDAASLQGKAPAPVAPAAPVVRKAPAALAR